MRWYVMNIRTGEGEQASITFHVKRSKKKKKDASRTVELGSPPEIPMLEIS